MSVEFQAFWEAVIGVLLIVGAVVLVMFNTKEVNEINIFAAVLVLESLPFLSAVGIAILENSRINSFTFWSTSGVRAAELIGFRREALPVPISLPQPAVSEALQDANSARPAE